MVSVVSLEGGMTLILPSLQRDNLFITYLQPSSEAKIRLYFQIINHLNSYECKITVKNTLNRYSTRLGRIVYIYTCMTESLLLSGKNN